MILKLESANLYKNIKKENNDELCGSSSPSRLSLRPPRIKGVKR